MSTPTDAKTRKSLPLFSGVLRYFPDALLAVAEVSRIGNDQHNPGQPLHWAKEKSRDELDALSRHLLDAGTMDTDGVRHSAKVAWRALANLQREIEVEQGYGYDQATDSWRKLAADAPPATWVPTVVHTAPRTTMPGELSETRVILGASRTGKGYDDEVREAELRRKLG